MDFELSREQKEIQKAVREFVKGEFKKDLIEELVEKHEYPVKIWKKATDLGFIGIHFPEDYSGMGLGCLENILVAEELCRGDSSIGTCLILADFASELIYDLAAKILKSSGCRRSPRARSYAAVPLPNRTTVPTLLALIPLA